MFPFESTPFDGVAGDDPAFRAKQRILHLCRRAGCLCSI